jgi:tetratricopeptide (TPR) repeat protein
MAQGKYDEAIKACDEDIRLEPSYAGARYSKGLALEDKSNYTEALKCFDEALGLDPKYATAYYAKGAVLKLLGRISEADVAFAKSTELG